ncbi:Hypothetical protein A7982_03658 [Minicystis rosea]|nr:Hypothetical protein A7982_03658 [Minicystis rosea]
MAHVAGAFVLRSGSPMARIVPHALFLVLLTACGGGSLEYRVPLGAHGIFPSGAGYPCKLGFWSKDALEVHNDVSAAGFSTKQLGSATVRCPSSTITFEIVELARLEIEGPDRVEVGSVPSPEYRLKGYDAGGREMDLDFGSEIAWAAPESFGLRQPRCGHMAAVCSGFVGAGQIQTASPREPGTVTLRASMKGKHASRTITVVPRGAHAP